MNMKENRAQCTMWCIRYKGEESFLKKASYGGFTLVDHPARATLYTSKRLAENRIARSQRQVGVRGGVTKDQLQVVLVRMSYQYVVDDEIDAL